MDGQYIVISQILFNECLERDGWMWKHRDFETDIGFATYKGPFIQESLEHSHMALDLS